MSTPEAGWYPDPSPAAPPSSLRWWDGRQWTGHARPGVTAAASVQRGPTTADGQRLAGWWWRVLATFVDSVIVFIGTTLATLPVQIEVQRQQMAYQRQLQERIERGEPVSPTDFWAPLGDMYVDHVLALVVVPVLLVLAYQGGMLRWRGATLGKLMCGLRVRPRAADGRLSWGTIAVRLGVQLGPGYVALALMVITGSVPLFLLAQLAAGLFYFADALTALGQRRQTIHDRAADTVVVTTR